MNTVKYHLNLFCSIFLLGYISITSIYYPQAKHPYASDQPMPQPKKFDLPFSGDRWHITFTPDGKTCYFVAGSSAGEMEGVYSSHFKNGKWSTPKETEFSGKYRIETPSISPDGKKFFFAKAMVKDNQGVDDIYVMDKTESGWSEPKRLDDPVNSPFFDASPTCAANGNLYFLSTRDGSNQIYCSKLINGKYSKPEAIEYSGGRFSPNEFFVAPDESYILSNSFINPNSFQLYISFNENGLWTTPVNLGPNVNFKSYQGRPCVSPDGNYLFYTVGDVTGWKTTHYQVDFKPMLDSLRYRYEISALSGQSKNIELKTSIVFKENAAKIKFDNTASWLKPYLKNAGKEKHVTNKINIEGLKAGIYKTKVKLSSEANPHKDYTYSVTLNVLDLHPAQEIKSLQKGIKYEYYEDTSFTTLPDFSKMKPLKTGITDKVDLTPRNRDSLYALVYNGYINIPQTAAYTFSLSSDDGSKLYIDDKLCINNDGLHGTMELSSNYGLEKGFHKIRVEFMQGRLGAYLELAYEARGAGIKRKVLSDNELFY